MNFEQLCEYLDSESNEYGLDSVAAHGFLSATVVGLSPSNWIAAFFEGHDQAVTDDVKQALHNWRQEILLELKEEKPIELPFLAEEGEINFDEDSDIVAWAIGFVDAMYADESVDWFADADTEEDVAMLTLPMILLSGIADEAGDDPELAAIRQDDDAMLQMVNCIEDNLTELFLLFHTGE